jgi:hypothetical protein
MPVTDRHFKTKEVKFKHYFTGKAGEVLISIAIAKSKMVHLQAKSAVQVWTNKHTLCNRA